MNRRVLLPVVAVAGLGALAVGLGSAVDRTPPTASPEPGFGGGPVPAPGAVTAAWAEVDGLGAEPEADSANACERGDPECLTAVIDEMAARLAALGCAHTAPFAFTYQEMTRGVDAAVREGAFDHPAATVHADALFARYYFQAFDNWAAGRPDDVPPSWRVAFGAAEDGRVNAAVNLLLGMNAHISRDLPYVVADVAAYRARPASGLTDFERINDVIDRVRGPMLVAAAERFDPTLVLLDSPVPALLSGEDVDLIGRWRDQALQRGLRLARARTGAERAAVEADIEQSSLATAVVLLNAGTAEPWPVSPAERDAYCQARRADLAS